MRVLVTGHRGYIGSHLIRELKERGYETVGVDLQLFEGCQWEPHANADHELKIDLCKLDLEHLRGIDCVMHLGAISNDPMGDLNPDLTYKINREGSIRLGRLAKQAGVKRFLFASSCSIYGKGEKLDLDETDALNPVSAYAVSKIDTERALMELADENFTPAYLRNSTAYGFSSMLRMDLVVNNLLGCAFAKGQIKVQSDGTPWRPLIHCQDIARAFVAFLEAPREKIHNRAINVGANIENYQVKDIADKVKRLLPNADIVFTGEVGNDPRNYRVKFDKLNDLLPNFKLKYTLDAGMDELFQKLKEHKFSAADFDGDQFVRLRTLKKRLNLLN